MKNVYYTESNTAQRVFIRDGQMDDGSGSPRCSSGGAVKKYREKENRKLGCAAQERDDQAQPASGFSCGKKRRRTKVLGEIKRRNGK